MMRMLDRSMLFCRVPAVVLAVTALSVFSTARGQSFTEFALPSVGSYPGAIAAGADGALCFTELFGNRIGRITETGAIIEFALPSPASQPSAIAAGSDGNLWFTENPNRVGRITTAGAITEFTVLNAAAMADITPGPDGNLWFTFQEPISGEIAFGNIGRITPAGVMTEFDPRIIGTIGAIAAGPDGALWFTTMFPFMGLSQTRAGTELGAASRSLSTKRQSGSYIESDGRDERCAG